MSFLLKTRSRAYRVAAMTLAATLTVGCNKDKLLQVSDPDILNIGDYESTDGANPLRYGVIAQFNSVFDGGTDAYVVISGNLGDELLTSDTFDGRLTINSRNSAEVNSEMLSTYRNLQRARASAVSALEIISRTSPEPAANRAQLYAYEGYTEVLLGEGWCPGVPISHDDGTTTTYGQPLTTQQIMQLAVVHFDSALGLATAPGAAVDSVRWFAQVGKARALLTLGQYTEAAAAVVGVPRGYVTKSQHSNQSSTQAFYSAISNGGTRYRLASFEGTNGLPYLETGVTDPRIPWVARAQTGFNNSFINQPDQKKYTQFSDGYVANGVEASLVRAEALLQDPANDAAVLDTLNSLRADATVVTPAMTALAAPANHAALIQLFFKERAFWLWLTGHRLGDMRRLVRSYGFGSESVFPTGDLGIPYLMTSVPLNGQYGPSTAITIPFQERNNPNFHGCLDGV